MKVNKLLTGTTLAVGLLISTAPVFAAPVKNITVKFPFEIPCSIAIRKFVTENSRR